MSNTPSVACVVCGVARQTKDPAKPCVTCKRAGRRLPAEDLEFILAQARTVWAADEAKQQARTDTLKESA